jgi:hypothetical protein
VQPDVQRRLAGGHSERATIPRLEQGNGFIFSPMASEVVTSAAAISRSAVEAVRCRLQEEVRLAGRSLATSSDGGHAASWLLG